MSGRNRRKFDSLVERLDLVEELKGNEELDKLITKLKLRMHKRGYCSGKTLNELSQAIILKLAPIVNALKKGLAVIVVSKKRIEMELEIARNEEYDFHHRASFFLHAYGHLKKAAG